MNYKNRKNDDDEDENDNQGSTSQYLGYFTKSMVSNCITVPIDEGVQEAKYYRHVAKAIAEATERDQIEFEISSPGGLLNGLIALLTAMEKTEATTVAHINGECHSAASMLALSCDSIYVSPYSTMLVHFVQFGASGKGTDVLSHVEHMYVTSEMLFRDTYKHFLTEAEINKCIEGLQLWLTAEDIGKRLERKFALMSKEVNKAKKAQKKTQTKSAPVEVIPDEEIKE